MESLLPEGHILTMATNPLPTTGPKNGWKALRDLSAFPQTPGRDSEGIWGYMRQLDSAYDPDSSLASPFGPSLPPASYAYVMHMSLGRRQALAGNACFTAKHTPASCSLPNPLAVGCWARWLSACRPHACISFPQKKKLLPVCLSVFFSSLPIHFFSCSLLPSFFFWSDFGSRFTKIKKKKRIETPLKCSCRPLGAGCSVLTPCTSGLPLKRLPFLSLPGSLCCLFSLQRFYQVLNTGVCSDWFCVVCHANRISLQTWL